MTRYLRDCRRRAHSNAARIGQNELAETFRGPVAAPPRLRAGRSEGRRPRRRRGYELDVPRADGRGDAAATSRFVSAENETSTRPRRWSSGRFSYLACMKLMTTLQKSMDQTKWRPFSSRPVLSTELKRDEDAARGVATRVSSSWTTDQTSARLSGPSPSLEFPQPTTSVRSALFTKSSPPYLRDYVRSCSLFQRRKEGDASVPTLQESAQTGFVSPR